MKRYIDAEAFFKMLNTFPYKDVTQSGATSYNAAISDACDTLVRFPAADVQEVQHGRWIEHQEGRWIYAKCSVCNSVQNTKTNYCKNCGAKMDKEK